MHIQTIVTTGRPTGDEDRIGRPGELTLNVHSGELRLHDGTTPNGWLIGSCQLAESMQAMPDMLAAPNGIATLGADGTLRLDQLPEAVRLMMAQPGMPQAPRTMDGGFF